MHLIDLTQTFTATMPVYPGDPPGTLKQVAHVDQDGFTDHVIASGMHVGTHMDAPLHMVSGGKTIPELPLESFMGPGVLFDARGKKEITPEVARGKKLQPGTIVLVWTDFDRNFRRDNYYSEHPVLTEDFARLMIEKKVKMIGMDMPSPDREPFPIHKILLGAGVLLLENLTNLQALEGIENFEVIALPVKFDSEGAFARAIAKIL